jgi:hypothetical protein
LVERVHHLTFVVALLALLVLRTWHMRDRRSRPAVHLEGIGGSDLLSAGIPVRDVRGMKWKPEVVCASTGNRTCRFAGLL